MNRTAFLLRELLEHPDSTQRSLAKQLSLSLGSVNALLSSAAAEGLIDPQSRSVTEAGMEFLKPFRMDGAVIMAAGFGSRFVPLTYDLPKGLLKVRGERMIERQIRQLQEVGITDIILVVGYLKEKFDYLVDKFGVKLLYNPDFADKNNISSVYHARKLLAGRNMYLLSSDNWMRVNMFHAYEPGAWYSSVFKKGKTREWVLSVNKKDVITDVRIGGEDAYVMYGPVCLSREFSDILLPAVEKAYAEPGKEQYYWENVYIDLLKENRGKKVSPEMSINRRPDDEVYEFENLEELRLFDASYQDHSDNAAMELISRVFHVPESEIREIRCLKAGMTNQSFLFSVGDRQYICRIPGVGTEQLISRSEEYENYQAAGKLGICEEVLYFNPENGYKISVYYGGSRNADPESPEDMGRCMALLRAFHASGAKVGHRFDIRERIGFYEGLCMSHGGIPFEDYTDVRARMETLLKRLDDLGRPETFSHVDSVATNFIFVPARGGKDAPGGDGAADDASGTPGETARRDIVRLIDWEYAGMADPLIDIAMCAIYSYYSEAQTELLMDLYFGRKPTDEERMVIYAYMALGGFLWTLWAVYKGSLGKTFGDYTLVMYRYAKDYYKKAMAI